MKPAGEIGAGLALLCIIVNTIFTFAMGLQHTAVGWITLACVLLMNAWIRLIQIADLMQAKADKRAEPEETIE